MNNQKVKERMESLGIVPLRADWTNPSDDIEKLLVPLRSSSIPLYAVFSHKDPARPLVLRDLISTQNVLDALEQAGPSEAASTSVADRSAAE